MEPPQELDAARVLEWAWSDEPFGFVGPVPIHGLAICRYPGAPGVYRFSCDRGWEVQQDQDHDTVEEAKALLPEQYRRVEACWQPAP